MTILAADTCTPTATAAIITDDRLVAQVVQNNKKTHSQNIMPMIDFMLKTADMTINDIDCFAAAVGPGSFTGVRIGVATVKALAHGTNKPCTSVSALEALAFNAIDFDGIICPIADARRGQVYNALFRGGSLERLTEDRVISAEELCAELARYGERVILLGDGTNAYADLIQNTPGVDARLAHRSTRTSLASSVAEIAYGNVLNNKICGPSQLAPLYLRMSQAERERREKLKQEKLNTK